jgi:hypothetical protein
VRALEVKLRDIKAYVKREKDAVPQAEAVIQAARLQRMHLDHIAAHQPAFLPSLPSRPAAGAAPPVLQARGNEPAPAAKKKASPPPAAAPRRYITQEEFESVSSYMRQRLTADKVNAALDEVAARAEATAALVSAVRRGRPAGADKKHGAWMLFNVADVEGVRGRFWALEADLRAGAVLRLDKTGKAVLTLLRHLGRVAEVRVPVEGTTHLVYALV